ncbi:MAG: 1-deoxy-D-xylulose-5-phosphate synthase [Bacteroidales bacterium]|nr:1-deoxy-D-xylulose-5-phosphate synthase [Bacteroidales bacterium]
MSRLLDTVNSPADLKGLSQEQLEQLCREIREYIVECCAHNPGHIGSSLGAVEIAVALHKVFDAPKDKIVWDVGHQAYAHKIITGRRVSFQHNREKDGLSGFPRRDESEYDAFGAGHASTSISAALGMAVADQLSGIEANHIAVIGDGAMSGGLAFEGLNNAGSSRANLLVILNDNRISIDVPNDAMHRHLMRITTGAGYNRIKKSIWRRLGEGKFREFLQALTRSTKKFLLHNTQTVSMFDSLGFRYFGPIDGNDLGAVISILERLKKLEGPKILHLVTVKGKGYKPAEENPEVWHAPGVFDPETGETNHAKGGPAKYQTVFGETVTELAAADPRIVGITPAMLRGSSLDIMKERFPDRVFDVGIAEGHAVTFSAGLAAAGMLPVCNIYSSFMQRAYDNLVHDVALQHLKVIFCLDRGGLVGEDGATHHGVFDMAAFRSVPGIAIASPYNETDLRNLLYSAAQSDWPATIIRYPRGCGEGAAWRGAAFEKIPFGKAVKRSDGGGVAILSIGPIGNKCAQAVEAAREKLGAEILHYDMRFLKPIDTEALEAACAAADTILTVEDGTVVGGLHGAVCEYVADRGLDKRVIAVGVPDKFIEQATVAQQYSECKMGWEDILQKVTENFGN